MFDMLGKNYKSDLWKAQLLMKPGGCEDRLMVIQKYSPAAIGYVGL